MTLLAIIQDVADLVGLPRPVGAFASSDTQVRQLIALANVEGRMLSRRHEWTALNREATHTTLAAELQGTLASIMPGLRYPLNETYWNRTQQRPLGGPLSAPDWQLLQGFVATGPYQDFRIKQGNLYLFPAPPAGETIAMEYVSSYWCESMGGTGQSRWVTDTDVGTLDEELITAGVRWRFLRAKGMDYSQEFEDYEYDVSNAIARDGNRRILSLDSARYDDVPTIRAPLGSWNL